MGQASCGFRNHASRESLPSDLNWCRKCGNFRREFLEDITVNLSAGTAMFNRSNWWAVERVVQAYWRISNEAKPSRRTWQTNRSIVIIESGKDINSLIGYNWQHAIYHGRLHGITNGSSSSIILQALENNDGNREQMMAGSRWPIGQSATLSTFNSWRNYLTPSDSHPTESF